MAGVKGGHRVRDVNDTDERNPTCALAGHGPCSGKISGEHYISHAALRRLAPGEGITISGTPWSAAGLRTVGKAALTANIVCQRDIPAVADRLGAGLHQLDSHRRQRPLRPFIGQGQGAQEVGEVLGEHAQLQPHRNAVLRWPAAPTHSIRAGLGDETVHGGRCCRAEIPKPPARSPNVHS